MTPDRMRELAREYVIEAAHDVDMVTIHEIVGPEDVTDAEAEHVYELIRSSHVEVTWPER